MYQPLLFLFETLLVVKNCFAFYFQFSFQRYIQFTTNTLVDKDLQDKQNGR